MLLKLFNHMRLTWRLARDRRVGLWLKIFLGGLPLVYAAIPTPDDVLPVVGLIDEVVFVGLVTLVFIAVCPLAIVNEHKRTIAGEIGDVQANLEMVR